MINRGRKGADYERKIANQLRKAGWAVIRSAASKGEFDLIAINKDLKQIKLIQCKRGKLGMTEIMNICQSGHKWQGSYSVTFRLEHKK